MKLTEEQLTAIQSKMRNLNKEISDAQEIGNMIRVRDVSNQVIGFCELLEILEIDINFEER